VTEALISLGHHFDMLVVAESVETEAEANVAGRSRGGLHAGLLLRGSVAEAAMGRSPT
jgi:EAL domain-containing protein (putative c-di-GMP-specific phosphodiesterase class I)